MRKYKQMMAGFMVVTLVGGVAPRVQAAEQKVTRAGYTLSKQAGVYQEKVRVKLKVKKGYRVYFTNNGKFAKTKVVKSGKVKTFTIKKTTTLSLYVSKKAMTVKQLKKKKVKKAAEKYVYTIDTALQGGNVSDDVMQDTVEAAAASAAAAEVSAMAGLPSLEAVEDTKSSVITFTEDTAKADGTGVEILQENGMTKVCIQKAGSYVLTGGSQTTPVKNCVIVVEENISEKVTLILDQLFLDNQALGQEAGQDVPIITIGKKTKDVVIALKGTSYLAGNGTFTEKPASAIIYAEDSDNVLRFLAVSADASLCVQDQMAAETDFKNEDPSDGIFTKGTLIMQDGTYTVSVNGDCLKGTGEDGTGGVVVMDGAYTLTTRCANGIRSKNGTISIFGGNITMPYTKEDGISAKNYGVNITGGNLILEHCEEDGIQGENVFIGGSDTKIDITTYFEDAGTNYYDTARGTGNYNIETSSMNGKEEKIYADTGSHKGIKAGTKACTYQYTSVEEGSKREAGITYTQEASGGLIIAGGEITINTKNTGIKYNGSFSQNEMSGAFGGNDEKTILGSPDDAIHSNHTCLITGGKITIDAADDGITSKGTLFILNDSQIDIHYCYEGIEAENIMVGAVKEAKQAPQITIYSMDDGVNASSKRSTAYVYADESEQTYTKTEVSSEENTFYMLDGYLNVMIGNDEEHRFSLPTKDGQKVTGTFRAEGDGIDCNGSFYAYGGTVIVYGPASGADTAVDVDKEFVIGNGVTLLAVGGTSPMALMPTSASQPSISYGISNESADREMENGMENTWMQKPEHDMNFPEAGRDLEQEMPVSQGGLEIPNIPNGQGMLVSQGGLGMPNIPNGQGMPVSQGGLGIPNGSMGQENSVLSAGEAFAILDQKENVLVSVKIKKDISSILYTSPDLKEGETYTISGKGLVMGNAVKTDNPYDGRYTGYDAKNAQVLSEVTAKK